MNWWGKLIGGAFGFILGGPIGALFGAAIGHNFDVGMQHQGAPAQTKWGRQERVQTAFFTATFSIMGYLCKADGRVSEEEIAIARQVMAQMDLNAEQRQAAMALFREGKKESFPAADVLHQLRSEIGYHPNLQRMFIEIQMYAAYADGVLHPAEKRVLQNICSIFGFSRHDFDVLAATIGGEVHHRSARHARTAGISLKDGYAVLGLAADATDAEVKKSYRRLMNQHHPDKLVSRGLPEEMIKVAEQRTHEIRQAYEKIKQARKF